jgi:hypothetical protein
MRRLAAASAACLATAALGAGIASTPAQAATKKWDLTRTPGNIAGVWAYGTYWKGGDGRLYVKVNVKDTASNKKDARVYLTAYYTNGEPRRERLVNGKGSGKTVTKTWSFRGDVYYIEGQECVDNSTSAIKCAGWGRVY